MDNLESKIRDYLVQNINILSDDLTIIQKEYKLDNDLGAVGFVDILAKDKNNNIVVIEIKRSKGASRSALHELNKYIALLKKNFRIKDSEVRLIIVSSEWDELLVPFSEYCKDVSLYIEGYKMILDNNNKPIKFQIITPINIDNSRAFSNRSMFFFFTEENFNEYEFLNKINRLMKRYGLLDYVVVSLDAKYKAMPFKYGMYVAYKRYNKDYLKNFIKLRDDDFKEDTKEYMKAIFRFINGKYELEDEDTYSLYNKIIDYERENECSDEEYIDFMEMEILTLLNSQIECNECDAGNAETFANSISNLWKVNKITKYGLYSLNLLNDKDIIIELTSIRERNKYIYNNYTESVNKAKVSEIYENFRKCLNNNPKWENELEIILSKLIKEKGNYRLSINIFNPCRILDVIARTINTGTYGFFPSYEVLVDYLDSSKVEIIRGMITWKKKDINFNEFYDRFFESSIDDFLLKINMGIIEEINDEIMEYLGLQYTSELLSFEEDELIQYEIDIVYGKAKLKAINENNCAIYFDEFFLSEYDFINPLLDLFERYTFNYIDDIVVNSLKCDEESN